MVVHDAGVEQDGSGGDPSVADAVVAEIVGRGGSASAAYENLDSREACRSVVAATVGAHGRLDVLVSNAGLARFAGIEETEPETWELLRNVHIEAPLWLAQAAFPHMRRARYGRMVFTVSGHGLERTGAADLTAYFVCKAATYGLMNALAGEGEPHGILANAVSPVAATRMYRRSAAPGELLAEHVAPGVAFLASGRCTTSGTVLRAADGRFSLGRWATTAGVDLGREPATPEDVAGRWLEIGH